MFAYKKMSAISLRVGFLIREEVSSINYAGIQRDSHVIKTL